MSSVRISNLPAAASLNGTEFIPVVKDGATQRATISQLTTASLDNFIAAGAGAEFRSAQDKMRDIVNVKDYGVKGNPTDDTAAFNAALAQGGTILVPKGVYVVSAPLNFTVAGTRLVGEGVTSTQIYQTDLSARLLNISAASCGAKSLSLDYSGTPTSGASAIYAGGAEGIFLDFRVNRAWKGLELTNINQKASDFDIYNCVDSSIHFNGSSGCQVRTFKLDAISATNAANGHIRMSNSVEGCIIDSADILNGVLSLLTEAAVYGAGTRPAYNRFSNVFFDGSASGSYLDKAVDIAFTNCWFSGGRTAVQPGITLGATDGVTFVNTMFGNCGSHGIRVTSASERTSIIGCRAFGNSVTAGAGVAHGIQIDANTNNFLLQNNTCANALFIGVQGYGINIAAGTSSNYSVTGNSVVGNATAGIFDGGTGSVKTVTGNPGYLTTYRAQATIDTGTNSVTFSHFLASTPALKDVILTPVSNIVAAGLTNFWVSAVTATQITVTANTNATSPFTFNFDVRVGNG